MRIILDRTPDPEDDGPLSSDAMTHCPTCGRKTVAYRNTISAPQVVGLRELARRKNGQARVRNLGLVPSAYCNLSKLKYWGLVQRLDNGGLYKVTEAGYDFLAGGQVQAVAISYNNQLIAREGPLVTIDEVSRFSRQREDYVADQIPQVPEPPQDEAQPA